MTCRLDVSYQFLTFVASPFFLKEYMFIFNIILKKDKNDISRFLKKKNIYLSLTPMRCKPRETSQILS